MHDCEHTCTMYGVRVCHVPPLTACLHQSGTVLDQFTELFSGMVFCKRLHYTTKK